MLEQCYRPETSVRTITRSLLEAWRDHTQKHISNNEWRREIDVAQDELCKDIRNPYTSVQFTTPVEDAIHLTDEEVNRIGKEKYEKQFAPILDTEENCGKFFVLDVVTDAHEFGDNLLALLKNAKERSPNDNIYVRRIGRDSVFSLR